MKILGMTYYGNAHHFTMKCDASLLNQRKPFFVPDWSSDMRYTPCLVVRISRLGKCIADKFAHRYYDAVADGLDFVAYDLLPTEYAQATAFDNSLCVGDWLEPDTLSEQQKDIIAHAIRQISQVVTLRMGDIIYIDRPVEAVSIHPEQIIEQDHLYCKIK
ncbi:MAG: hypothetical protein MJZ75_02510 [Paludibacteraceae bacterium]|nr:hypothetical protein [Paludibacteraceae bacterium]